MSVISFVITLSGERCDFEEREGENCAGYRPHNNGWCESSDSADMLGTNNAVPIRGNADEFLS